MPQKVVNKTGLILDISTRICAATSTSFCLLLLYFSPLFHPILQPDVLDAFSAMFPALTGGGGFPYNTASSPHAPQSTDESEQHRFRHTATHRSGQFSRLIYEPEMQIFLRFLVIGCVRCAKPRSRERAVTTGRGRLKVT